MKLTSKRVNGIKSGYWTAAKKDDVVQRLGAIEDKGPELLERSCRYICGNQAARGACEECPVDELRRMIG